MKQHTTFLVLAFALLAVLACDATQVFNVSPAPTATMIAKPKLPGDPPALKPTFAPPALASPTPTALPMKAAATATPAASSSKYAFHINFLIDESAKCPTSTKCDSYYIPKMTLYFRGDVTVSANRLASGSGSIVIASMDACKTLLPDTSSCKVTGVTNGSFTISGEMQGDKLQMTLQLTDLPRIAATMTTQHPSGPVTIGLDNSYQDAIKNVFEKAKIFGSPIQGTPTVPASNYTAFFEASYTFGNTRTTHGYGSLFFISPDTAPLKPYLPQ